MHNKKKKKRPVTECRAAAAAVTPATNKNYCLIILQYVSLAVGWCFVAPFSCWCHLQLNTFFRCCCFVTISCVVSDVLVDVTQLNCYCCCQYTDTSEYWAAQQLFFSSSSLQLCFFFASIRLNNLYWNGRVKNVSVRPSTRTNRRREKKETKPAQCTLSIAGISMNRAAMIGFDGVALHVVRGLNVHRCRLSTPNDSHVNFGKSNAIFPND